MQNHLEFRTHNHSPRFQLRHDSRSAPVLTSDAVLRHRDSVLRHRDSARRENYATAHGYLTYIRHTPVHLTAVSWIGVDLWTAIRPWYGS